MPLTISGVADIFWFSNHYAVKFSIEIDEQISARCLACGQLSLREIKRQRPKLIRCFEAEYRRRKRSATVSSTASRSTLRKKRVPDYFHDDSNAKTLRLVCDTAALRKKSNSYFGIRINRREGTRKMRRNIFLLTSCVPCVTSRPSVYFWP